MEAQKKRQSIAVSLARLYTSAAVQPAAIAADFDVRRDAHGGAENRMFSRAARGACGGSPPANARHAQPPPRASGSDTYDSGIQSD